MKIVVISDTHIPKKAKMIPSRLVTDLKKADLIVHAGDWQTIDVFNALSAYAKVEGVVGNVDGADIQQHFRGKEILHINGFKIGITHGHGQKMTTEKRAIATFEEDHVNCIIFGHSHIPVLKHENDVLIFNPGSPTDKRRQPFYSYGTLTIDNDIHAQHVFFTDKT